MASMDDLVSKATQCLLAANFNDAAIYFTEILQRDEHLSWAWANRGVAFQRLGHPFDAILNFDRALQLDPESAILHNNKGAAYWELENAQEALKNYHKAAELDPTMAHPHMNMGNVLKYQGDLEGAIASYKKATEIDPNYADAQMACGMSMLREGFLEEGWKRYEYRWKTDQLMERKLKFPTWKGEDLSGKNILVYMEQGLGDAIQFARYVRVLAQRYPKCRVILEGKQPLKRLFETIPDVYAVINFGEKIPAVDYAVPMLSLPGLCHTTMKNIPASRREYFLRRDDVEMWAEKFKLLPEGFKVGLCWAGLSRAGQPAAASIDALRSTTLETFRPLAAIPGIIWVSLQKGEPAGQIRKPPTGMTIGDFTEDMYDFYETACAIENCDLVISVDTAVVHVAASIGKPTWVLSRWDGCWRWHGTRSDSPWYPSVRQFTQPAPHDWDGMIQKVAEELKLAMVK